MEDHDDDIFGLNDAARLTLAEWACAAQAWGGWDWNLLCCDDNPDDAVDARWELARFLDEQGLLRKAWPNFEPETYIDEDTGEEETTDLLTMGAILLTFLFAGLRASADRFGVTAQEVVDDPLRYIIPQDASEAA